MTRTLALALVALSVAAPAGADEVEQARQRFDRGVKLYRAGKYKEAVDQFEAAYRLKPHGAIHFNVAQCRERLEEWPGALRSYHDYLREVPDARDRAAVRASIGKIERRLAAAGVQALLVYTDPPGASVRIDGKARGRTPFHITLPPGVYRLGLGLDGYQPEEAEADLTAAAARVVDVVLRPKALPTVAAVPPPAGAAGAPAAAAGTAAAAGKPSSAPAVPASSPTAQSGAPAPDLTARPPETSPIGPPASPPGPQEPAPRKRLYTWIAAGAAVAAGAAGIFMGASAKAQEDKLKDGTVHPDADQIAKDAQSKAKAANVLYGISGVAAAAGVTLYFVEVKF
jgi:hypothetical protein